MALSPFDVEHKTFRTALRGYAEEEVDQSLDEVVASLREYEQRLTDALERLAELESELATSQETEAAIKRTFIAAQRTADQIIDEAQQEATRLVADARAEAAQYEVELTTEREKARSEIDAMRDAVDQIKEQLRRFSESTSDDVSALEEAFDEASETYGLHADEEPTFEIPALVEEDDAEEFEYFEDEEERPVHPEPAEEDLEAATTGLASGTETLDDVSSDEDLTVHLGEGEEAVGQTVLRRSRPRRPWERES
jgi:cell division initiation protein